MIQNFLQSTWKTGYAKSNNILIRDTDDINENIIYNPKDIPSTKNEVFH